MSHPDPHFTELCKLLRAKKYERPPPGYFNGFADRVLTRIEAEETVEYSSWWNWLMERFDAKPVFVCAYGLAVSGLLFAGLRLSQGFEAEMAATPDVGGPWFSATPASPLLLQHEYSQFVHTHRPLAAHLDADSQFALRGSLLPVSVLTVAEPLSGPR
jgi:hypothetical protein